MSTLAPPELIKTADEWEALADYPSAVCSGIVGDLAHKLRGGYHISIMDQPSDNFSVVRVDDKAPPGTWRRDFASAIDMNMSLADMKRCHARMVNLWRNRHTDPRAKYFNAWNGWDGNGSPGRYNFVTGTVEEASDDHTWHGHCEPKRRYANDPQMRKALISTIKGETVAQYLGEEDLVTTQAEFDEFMDNYLARQAGKDRVYSSVNQDKVQAYNTNPVTLAQVIRPATATDNGLMTWASALTFAVRNTDYLKALGLLTDDKIDALSTLVKTIPAKVDEVSTVLAKFIVDEMARDAQEAARDAGLKAIVSELNNAKGSSLSDEQFQLLLAAVTDKVVEAGQDAVDQASRKIDQIAEALDNAGEALATANDSAPQA